MGRVLEQQQGHGNQIASPSCIPNSAFVTLSSKAIRARRSVVGVRAREVLRDEEREEDEDGDQHHLEAGGGRRCHRVGCVGRLLASVRRSAPRLEDAQDGDRDEDE